MVAAELYSSQGVELALEQTGPITMQGHIVKATIMQPLAAKLSQCSPYNTNTNKLMLTALAVEGPRDNA